MTERNHYLAVPPMNSKTSKNRVNKRKSEAEAKLRDFLEERHEPIQKIKTARLAGANNNEVELELSS